MADFSAHHKMLPGMKKRPEMILCDKKDAKEDAKSESMATFLFLKNCKNYELNLEGKAAKVMCENCVNLTISLTDPLVSGVLEIFKCSQICVRMTGSCEIPTFHIEDADNVKIEVPDKLHIRNIFFQQSSNLEIMLSGSEDGHFVINEPALGNEENDQKQFVAFWNESKSDLVTENLKRSGIYPLADQKLVKNLK